MPVFTSLAAFLTFGGAISAFLTSGIGSFLLSTAAGVGLNLLAKAIAGTPSGPKQEGPSVQGKLAGGGDVPRSFMLSEYCTAGSLVYANTYTTDITPNNYLIQVIALSDIPVKANADGLREFWVNGEKCTIRWDDFTNGFGHSVVEYENDSGRHLFIRFYDGTQTTADAQLVAAFGSDPDRPYLSNRVGKGCAYAIVSAIVNDKLFSGFPTFKFTLGGMKLYDISKDSTAGGTGAHRWSDATTWGGDGDDLPAVQLYNIMRGITYNGEWIYGPQGMTAPRLPASNWIAQINKCREPIEGVDGDEPTYRSGAEIKVSTPIADTMEALLSACQGKISETGGFYKLHCGGPGSADFVFIDDQIISTEEQSFAPFFGLADTINGMTAKYPSPAEGWNSKVAPPLYRSDLEAQDGGRRLMADVSLDCVPYDAQVQRLMKSALEEARRARRHTFTMPPEFWLAEPGDVAAWTSERNGYDGKLFRVDGVLDKPNLDVTLDLTECDPSDFDWDHGTDFIPPVIGPTGVVRPPAQPIYDWAAAASTVKDTDGISRRPAILLSWNGTVLDVQAVQFEIRLNSSHELVSTGRFEDVASGSGLASQGLLPNTAYQVRGRYVPANPRDTTWSAWLTVTTPDVRLSIAEFDAALHDLVTNQLNAVQERIDGLNAKFDSAVADVLARTRLDKQGLRQQSWDHREDLISRIAVGDAALGASIEETRTVAINNAAAFADYQLVLTATFGAIRSDVNVNATAVADTNAALSSYEVSTNARLGTAEAGIVTNSTAIATTNAALASFTTSVTATLGSHTTSISANSTAIAGIGARVTVKTDVDGYVAGTELINGGPGLSAFTISADYFKIAKPGIGTSGDPQLLFTTGTVSGSAKLVLRGDIIADGAIAARNILAGAIVAGKIAAGAIDASNILVDNIVITGKMIGDAATAITPVTPAATAIGGAGGSDNTSLLASATISTLVGRLVIIVDAYMSSNPTVYTLDDVRTYLEIWIDGAKVAERTWQVSYNEPPSYRYATWGPIAFASYHSISGSLTSPPSHTIQLKVRAGAGAAYGPPYPNIKPTMVIMESRR